MNVIEIKNIENDQTNHSTIWFVLEEYPDSVFGLRHFPNAEFKKDYIIHDPNTNYIEQVEMLKAIESNLAAIKSGLEKIMPNYPQYRTKLLFKPDIF